MTNVEIDKDVLTIDDRAIKIMSYEKFIALSFFTNLLFFATGLMVGTVIGMMLVGKLV